VDDFREFVAVHTGEWSRLAYVLAGSHAGAEDLVQTALLKTARRWRRVAGYDHPEAYVRRAIYHAAVSQWRRARLIVERPVAAVPERPAAGDDIERATHRLVLEAALARLTPRQRAVLVLRFYEDRSVAEAAETLGCSVGTVKSQTAYALERLRVLAPDLVDLIREEATP
jgi:RNA polymerase sigma-70 factor (sigma-E family)